MSSSCIRSTTIIASVLSSSLLRLLVEFSTSWGVTTYIRSRECKQGPPVRPQNFELFPPTDRRADSLSPSTRHLPDLGTAIPSDLQPPASRTHRTCENPEVDARARLSRHPEIVAVNSGVFDTGRVAVFLPPGLAVSNRDGRPFKPTD
jgi:hypothetical protein